MVLNFLTLQSLPLYLKTEVMFAVKVVLFHFFGWLMLLGSSDLSAFPSASYTPVDSIISSDNKEHIPLIFDAILDVNHSFTYETPVAKTFPQRENSFQKVTVPLFYELSYYTIGQQIVVNLSVKTIIFPFHCFT